MVVTDLTVFNDHKRLSNTDDIDLIFLHMKIYYLHLLSGVIRYKYTFCNTINSFGLKNKVNHRYENTFENDTDIRINIMPTNFLFLTVRKRKKINKYDKKSRVEFLEFRTNQIKIGRLQTELITMAKK